MVSTLAKIVSGGACVFSLGGLAWVQSRANLVEKEQRGSLLARASETAMSAIKFEDGHIYNQATIEKQKKHIKLVSALSSRQYAVTSKRLKDEENKIALYYSEGYLLETTSKASGRPPFVFRYSYNLPVILPNINSKPSEGFIFSGFSSKVHDIEAREQILKGQYTRCSVNLPYKNMLKTFNKMDVVVTGTTDRTKCASFYPSFMHDIVMTAAAIPSKKGLDASHPLSDTHVFTFEESDQSIKRVGDLANFPEAVKETARSRNFTHCPFYTYEKIRLSQGFNKPVGAVVVGVRNQTICDQLHFNAVRALTETYKIGKVLF